MLTRNHRQEALCRAYIQAVAARCGMRWSSPLPDYCIDLSVHEIVKLDGQRTQTGYQLDVQPKATTRGRVLTDHVRYDIRTSTYDTLRLALWETPRILVVLVLPEGETNWVSWTEDTLILRRCADWISLRGHPPTPNRKSVRLRIPRAHVFSPAGLRETMERMKGGGRP